METLLDRLEHTLEKYRRFSSLNALVITRGRWVES
jgi:hypothetical protein